MPAVNNADINNHFGDMDLYLMDALLKGHVPGKASILDVGSGEGRNGIYFIKEGFSYHGIDPEKSKTRLLQYLADSLKNPNASFTTERLEDVDLPKQYDFIIASRVLHFAPSQTQLLSNWNKLAKSLSPGGIIYFAMDSAMASSFVMPKEEGFFEFKDGRISLALTEQLYQRLSVGFEEVEPLKTIVYHNSRVQSFGLLRKH